MATPGPRHRASASTLQISGAAQKYNLTHGYWVYDTPIEATYLELANSMDDVVIENFKTRSAAGEIFNNPCTKIETKVHRQAGHYSITQPKGRNPRYRYSGWNDFSILDLIPDIEVDIEDRIADAITAAATAAMASVSSEKILIGATLGELGETRQMLMTALTKLRYLDKVLKSYIQKFTDVRRSPLWKTKEGLRLIEEKWMEVRMGWRPFYYEVQQLYAAMQKLEKLPGRQTFRAKRTFTIQESDVYNYTTNGHEHFVWNRSFLGSYTVSAGVLAKQRYAGVPDTYGLTKIPQVIWELTKLSWAVDYFLNIGSLIAAYVPDTLWHPAAAWVTVRKREVYKVALKDAYQEGYTYSLAPQIREREIISYIRNPEPPIGLTFSPKLNLAKLTDTVIAVKQLFLKTRRSLRGKSL